MKNKDPFQKDRERQIIEEIKFLMLFVMRMNENRINKIAENYSQDKYSTESLIDQIDSIKQRLKIDGEESE